MPHLATGFSRALLVAAAATRLALITAILAIGVKRADLGEALFWTTPGSRR
jgi:ABC-type cobalamin transport system permease subunit